jgi:cell division septal protein FtsQ
MSQKYESKSKRKRRKQNRILPLLLGLGGLVLLVVAALALRGGNSDSKASIEVNGAPSIKVDKEIVDLGEVKLGQAVETTFKITNVGDQDLRFEEQPYIEVVEGC